MSRIAMQSACRNFNKFTISYNFCAADLQGAFYRGHILTKLVTVNTRYA